MESPGRSVVVRRLALAACALLAAALGLWWLFAAHSFAPATRVAQEFVALLQQGQFERAHALALHNADVGATPIQLERVAARQLCQVDHVAGTTPRQSNGNRLRRWLRGAEVEPAGVTVEFEGGCLLGVALRHTGHEGWKVARFASHAG